MRVFGIGRRNFHPFQAFSIVNEFTGKTRLIQPNFDHWKYVELKSTFTWLFTPRRYYCHARWYEFNVFGLAVDCREKSAHIVGNLLPVDDDISLDADGSILDTKLFAGLRKCKTWEYAAR